MMRCPTIMMCSPRKVMAINSGFSAPDSMLLRSSRTGAHGVLPLPSTRNWPIPGALAPKKQKTASRACDWNIFCGQGESIVSAFRQVGKTRYPIGSPVTGKDCRVDHSFPTDTDHFPELG